VASSPAVADGIVFVGSFDGKVYALNASDGEFVWSYMTGAMVVSSPAVANGMLYVGSYDHHLYAFGASSDEQTYSVTFTASGLPSGTSWNVTFNGQTQSSTSDTIVFDVPNGVYAFTVIPPGGYEASPSSGSVTVHFADVDHQVTFTSTMSAGLSQVELAVTLAIVVAVVMLAILIYIKRR
jgi:outer membrane protein assembly factor BamB